MHVKPFVIRSYVIICCIVLAATSVLKLIAIETSPNDFEGRNAILPFLNDRIVVCSSAAMELLTIILAVKHLTKLPRFSLFIIGWVGLIFGTYRTLMLLTVPASSCRCFGVLELALGTYRPKLEWLGWSIIVFFILGFGLIKLLKPAINRASHSVVLTFALLLFFSQETQAAGDQSYRVEGIVTINFWTTEGKLREKQQFTFACERSNSVWKIESVSPGGFRIVSVFKSNSVATIFNDTDGGNSPLKVHLRSTPFPVETYFVQLPWLAFTPDDVLRESEIIPAPWLLPRDDPRAHVFRSEQRVSSNGLRSVIFITDEILSEAAPRSPLLQRELKSDAWFQKLELFKANSDPGFVNAVFTTTSATNIDGNTIPLSFKLETFFSGNMTGDHKQRTASVFEGSVTKLIIGNASGDYSTTRSLGILDYRFRSNTKPLDYIEYETNILFTEVKDARLQGLYREKLERMPVVSSRFIKRLLTYSFLSIALILPFVVWLRIGKSKVQPPKQRQQNEK